ncbi:MAG: NUDIX hydrolase [Bacilli bacterium]|nr:NUDIX hydrolase [Bacilli bacterium]
MEKEYSSEEEFLKAYDSSKFEKLSMTTDVVIFSVSNKEQSNYRKLDHKVLSVLLVKRNNYPFKDKWCIPGGFLRMDETLDESALRILKDETGLHDIYLEQLYTFSEINRDPRLRVVSTAYMTLIDKNRLEEKILDNASWFDIDLKTTEDEYIVTLDNGEEQIHFTVKKTLRELTTDRYSFEETSNDLLAFDHSVVIISALERLKNKLEYTDIVFNMMGELFTLGELQQVYEVILGKKLLDPAFRRIIANKVEKTNELKKGDGHRPSVLFRYKGK